MNDRQPGSSAQASDAKVRRREWSLPAAAVLVALLLLNTNQASASRQFQPPTLDFPTVTGSPIGPQIVVPDQVNVRTGPDTLYEQVGVLIAGQRAPAIGRSAGGLWIQIRYPGVPGEVAWVYAPFVVLEPPGANLPIIEPPPTSTPRVTATIDPTFAAQFNLSDITPTRLPTYTAPPPVAQPTFAPVEISARGGLPPIAAIAGLVLIGMFGLLISVLRGG